MITALIVTIWVLIGIWTGKKAVHVMFPVSRPEMIEAGCIIMFMVIAWPVLMFCWLIGRVTLGKDSREGQKW